MGFVTISVIEKLTGDGTNAIASECVEAAYRNGYRSSYSNNY